MAHKQGSVVEYLYYCCVVGACSNTEQGLLCGRRDLAGIHLVEKVQDLLGKQSGKHTFNKKLLILTKYHSSIYLLINWMEAL